MNGPSFSAIPGESTDVLSRSMSCAWWMDFQYLAPWLVRDSGIGKTLAAAIITSTYSNAPLPGLPGYAAVTGLAGNAMIVAGIAPPKPVETPAPQ
jgi:hypothetical protein